MLVAIKQIHKRHSVDSLGDLLLHGETPVGVLLKIQHHSPSVDKPIINLSSWYVEPEYRWYAPRMLLKATSDKSFIYTDLSPSPDVYSINERLGFKTITSHHLLFPLFWTAFFKRSNAKILEPSDIRAQRLSEDLRGLMAQHQSNDMLPLIIEHENGLSAVIFQIRKRRGLRCANLIYSDNIKLVRQAAPQIAAYLLRQAILFMTMPASDTQSAPGAKRLQRFTPYQVKGDWHENMVDQTYSEAILLPYHV